MVFSQKLMEQFSPEPDIIGKGTSRGAECFLAPSSEELLGRREQGRSKRSGWSGFGREKLLATGLSPWFLARNFGKTRYQRNGHLKRSRVERTHFSLLAPSSDGSSYKEGYTGWVTRLQRVPTAYFQYIDMK